VKIAADQLRRLLAGEPLKFVVQSGEPKT